MATGINVEKLDGFKVELLDFMESLNSIQSRLDSVKTVIQANMSGNGKSEVVLKLNSIMEQLPSVKGNINVYISLINSVIDSYEVQDDELSSNIINDVVKLEQ